MYVFQQLEEYQKCHMFHGFRQTALFRTFILFKVERILLVSDDFLHVDNTAVFELTQDLDLSDGCDGEALLLIVQTHFFQSHQFT